MPDQENLAQQALVAAIFRPEQVSDFDPRGLAIYRRNLLAGASRSLEVSFPTVLALIGEELFNHAAEQLLQQSPPSEGDWGLWGHGFAKILEQLAALKSYPFVADCARLDMAAHQLERGIDQAVEMDSMSLLTTAPPDQLAVTLSANLYTLRSDFPVVDIWQAHQSGDNAAEQHMQAAQDKLACGEGQLALITRPQFRAQARALTEAEFQWLGLLQQGHSLGQALNAVAETDFDLSQWLPLAIEQQLIIRLHKL